MNFRRPSRVAEDERMFPLSDTAVIVLAAGKGTRMKSRRAKVLHELCGVPMLGHVLRNAKALTPSRLIVVIGTGAEEVRARFPGVEVERMDQNYVATLDAAI